MADTQAKQTEENEKAPFLQTVAVSSTKLFYQKFLDLERYAIDNNLPKPKKNELLEHIFNNYLKKVEPEDYFKKAKK